MLKRKPWVPRTEWDRRAYPELQRMDAEYAALCDGSTLGNPLRVSDDLGQWFYAATKPAPDGTNTLILGIVPKTDHPEAKLEWGRYGRVDMKVDAEGRVAGVKRTGFAGGDEAAVRFVREVPGLSIMDHLANDVEHGLWSGADRVWLAFIGGVLKPPAVPAEKMPGLR